MSNVITSRKQANLYVRNIFKAVSPKENSVKNTLSISELSIDLSFTNISIILMLISMATEELRTAESIETPCSVNA